MLGSCIVMKVVTMWNCVNVQCRWIASAVIKVKVHSLAFTGILYVYCYSLSCIFQDVWHDVHLYNNSYSVGGSCTLSCCCCHNREGYIFVTIGLFVGVQDNSKKSSWVGLDQIFTVNILWTWYNIDYILSNLPVGRWRKRFLRQVKTSKFAETVK